MKPQLQAYVELVRAGPHGLFSRGDLARLDEHALDGSSGAALLERLGARSIVDVGSGGGVPGLPLAIDIPDAHVHLVESQRWKAEFLLTCAHALDLESRVTVHALRAEEAVDEIGRETLDAGVARAVARPELVAEYLAPFVRVGGHLVLWTTRAHAEAPISDVACERLGLGDTLIHEVDTPLREHAVLLQIDRIAPCDVRIPRRAGVAARKPLR